MLSYSGFRALGRLKHASDPSGRSLTVRRYADSPVDAKKRVTSLRKLLKQYSKAYYVESKSLVSDEEYDKLFSELVVGSSLTKQGSAETIYEHKTPMLSLANAFSLEDVKTWDARIRRMSGLETPSYAVEIKYDGIALAVHYENGKFVRALTRGDGKTGEDASAQVRRFLPVLTKDLSAEWSQHGSKIEIRGEVFMTKDAFTKLNTGEGKTFTNARNLTSGLLKRKAERLEAEPDVSVELSFVGYGMIAEKTPSTHEGVVQTISKLGLPTGAPYFQILHSIADFETLERDWASLRGTFPFEADGLVVKLNERDLYDRLGSTSHSPRWAVAWKFSAKQATSTLLSIELSVGRSGKVTPVAIIEPVRLAGVQISRATLHNKDYIDKNLFVPGCKVIVERSGDVIPKIVGRTESHGESPPPSPQHFQLPSSSTIDSPSSQSRAPSNKTVDWTHCPCSMKHPLVPSGNVDYVCTNPHCPPQQQRKLEHFCAALEIDGLGPSSLKHLVEGGLVSNFSDIFALKDHSYAKLAMRDGWGEKKVTNLLSSIEAAKQKTTLATLLYALGIPHVGKETAETLAQNVGSIKQLALCQAEELERVEDVGPVVAGSIVTYFALPSTKPLLDSLEAAQLPMVSSHLHSTMDAHGQFSIASSDSVSKHGASSSAHGGLVNPQASLSFHGLSFVFTGALETMSRKEAEVLVKQAGGKAKASVTKGTTYLVEGKAVSAARTSSSKLTQAKTSGTKVITEFEFLDLLKGTKPL